MLTMIDADDPAVEADDDPNGDDADADAAANGDDDDGDGDSAGYDDEDLTKKADLNSSLAQVVIILLL